MKRQSGKRRKRESEARPVRNALIDNVKLCEICKHSPRRPWRDKPRECSRLCCHEIANGPNRQKSLDKPFALLVLCWWCNGHVVTDKSQWPESRQLSVLQRSRPDDYNLRGYLELTNPRAPERIMEAEVDAWL